MVVQLNVPDDINPQRDQVGFLVLPPPKLGLQSNLAVWALPAADVKALLDAWQQAQRGLDSKVHAPQAAKAQRALFVELAQLIESGALTMDDYNFALNENPGDPTAACKWLLKEHAAGRKPTGAEPEAAAPEKGEDPPCK